MGFLGAILVAGTITIGGVGTAVATLATAVVAGPIAASAVAISGSGATVTAASYIAVVTIPI